MITKHRKIFWKNTLAGIGAVLLLGGCTMTESQRAPSDLQNDSLPAVREKTDSAGTDRSEATPSSRAETPAPGKEGNKVAALDDVSVYAQKIADGLQRRFTIRINDGTNASYLWDYEPGGGGRSVIISSADLNKNGHEEVILFVPTGNGTELSLQQVHVLDRRTLDELPVQDPIQLLGDGAMQSSIQLISDQRIVNAELNGVHMTKRYKDGDSTAWNDRIGFGSHVSYALAGDTLTARLTGRASIGEFPLIVHISYDRDLSVSEVSLYPNAENRYTEEELLTHAGNLLNIKGMDKWKIETENGIYQISAPAPENGAGESATFGVNSVTGTLFDDISGAPVASLIHVSPNEAHGDLEVLQSSNGTKYSQGLNNRLRELAEDAGWKPVGSGWIEGFAGDGYVLCRVEWEGRETIVKADVFTGMWEEYVQ